MEVHANGYRYYNNDEYETKLHQPYDYAKKGLVNHLLSHTIVETTNPILKIMLQYYEKTLIFLMKYVDILKNFKNYNWQNR